MWRWKRVWIVGVWLVVCGCSHRSEPPPAEGVTSSSPASPASQPRVCPQRKGPRHYMAFPSSFAPGPDKPAQTLDTLKASFQLALASQKYAQAKAFYEQLCSRSDATGRLRVLLGCQLIHQWLNTDPPDIAAACSLLDRLSETVRADDVPNVIRDQYRWWRLILHITEGAPALRCHREAYTAWRDTLIHRVEQVDRIPLDVTPLLHAVARLVRAEEGGGDGPAERVDEVLSVLQRCFRSVRPDLLRVLQLYCVNVYRSCGRFPEALAAVRGLLALSACDAAGWSEAVRTARDVMHEAGWEASRIAAWATFLQWGPAGADGRQGTGDDCHDPLASTVPTGSQPAHCDTTASAPASESRAEWCCAEDALRSAYRCILSDRGSEALACLAAAMRLGPTRDRLSRKIIDGIAMAQALEDGHLLGVEAAVDRAVASMRDDPAVAFWRYQAARFRWRRDAMVRDLIESGRPELALGVCRSIANRWDDPQRGRAVLDAALQACRALVEDRANNAELVCFEQFGAGLTAPEARVHQVRLAAEAYRQAGEIEAAVRQIQKLEPLWRYAERDPDLVLLAATLLVRTGRSDRALPRVQHLVDRPDIDEVRRMRARLLLGVIYVQQGQPVEARRTLRALIENPPSDVRCKPYLWRARDILEKLGA